MRPDVRDAVDAARSARVNEPLWGSKPRNISAAFVRAVVYAVVRELPDDMSVRELREELDIAENQGEGQ